VLNGYESRFNYSDTAVTTHFANWCQFYNKSYLLRPVTFAVIYSHLGCYGLQARR
jgi:hypothetical protein